ncbi:MAG: hypothetical protein AB7L09_00590 [Nitrospira sp.]
MKKCSRCDIEQPVDNFYTNRRTSDGLASWCKQCSNAATAAARKKRACEGRKESRKKPAWMECRSCGTRLRWTSKNFMRDKHQPHGLYKRCRDCTNAERAAHRAANPLPPEEATRRWERQKQKTNDRINKDPIKERARRMHLGVVERTRRSGLPLDITRDDVESMLRSVEACPCCGVELDPGFVLDRGRQPNSPSIDRFDPALGYTIENSEILCWRCNALKKDATIEEIRALAEWMTSRTPR